MIDFLLGPLVWLAFAVFILGSAWRIVSMGLLARKDKVVHPTWSFRFGARSVMHWLLPFGTRSMRLRPLFTVVSFAFHICLLLTPLFVMGHAVLWERAWGLSWWSLPPVLADLMTIVVVAAGVFFFLRRIAAPQVRKVTTWSDYAIVLLVVSPFATGLAAHHQWFGPELTTALHIICGAAWLIAIPFTRLSHMLWFVFTRAFMGSEFGAVRNEARDW